MRKFRLFVTLCLLFSLLVPAALADNLYEDTAPYSSADLTGFKNAGYKSYYDSMRFIAELTGPSTISKTLYDNYGSLPDGTYTLQPNLRMTWNGTQCTWIPRLLIGSSGYYTYSDDAMNILYIKVGQNRYSVDISGVSRSTKSKEYNATESGVIPFGPDGLAVLKYICSATETVSLRINTSRQIFTLSSGDITILKNFLSACEAAGIFNQPGFLSYDDTFGAITLFNQN